MSATTASASWMRNLGKNVRSVKFLLCPKSPASAPAREFFVETYNVVKHLNPNLPYMIRPWPGDAPSVIIEYDYSEKAQVPLVGLDKAGLERKVSFDVMTSPPPPSPALLTCTLCLPQLISIRLCCNRWPKR